MEAQRLFRFPVPFFSCAKVHRGHLPGRTRASRDGGVCHPDLQVPRGHLLPVLLQQQRRTGKYLSYTFKHVFVKYFAAGFAAWPWGSEASGKLRETNQACEQTAHASITSFSDITSLCSRAAGGCHYRPPLSGFRPREAAAEATIPIPKPDPLRP